MILVGADGDRLFVYNRAAHLLWRASSRHDTLSIMRALASRHGLAFDVARNDVISVVDQWIELGLVEGDGGATGRGIACEALSPGDLTGGDRSLASRHRFGALLVELVADAATLCVLDPLIGRSDEWHRAPDLRCVVGLDQTGKHFFAVDGRLMASGLAPEVAVGAFYQAVINRLHPETAWRAFLHAAAVAKGERAVIFAAPSGSGKSTLTAALVARGYEFLSDDIVALRSRDDAVVPFPLPTRVKHGSLPILSPLYPALTVASGDSIQYLAHSTNFDAPPRAAHALVFATYEPGSRTRFGEISTTDAASRLFADRVFLGYPIEPVAVAGFIKWLQRVKRHELIYSDLNEAERCITMALAT